MPSIQDSDDRIIQKGVHGPYHWITFSDYAYIGTFLATFPEAVLGHHLAVTSRDSGVRRLSQTEVAAGWCLRGGIAYSPRITDITSLGFQRDGLDSPGYDEWYVFETAPPDLGHRYKGDYFKFKLGMGDVMTFESRPAFVLHDPNPYMPGILDLFWNQLLEIRPKTYIADGEDHLTIVSKDWKLIDTAGQRLGRP